MFWVCTVTGEPGTWVGVSGGAQSISLLKLTGIQDSVTAFAGGGQASATALSATASVYRVTTVATGADSVKLPAAAAGDVKFLMNSAATNSMQVFGTGTDTINDVAAATGVAHAAGKGSVYVCVSTGSWYRALGA